VTGCRGVARAVVTGQTITLLPQTSGACVLTVADASAPSVTATVAIDITPVVGPGTRASAAGQISLAASARGTTTFANGNPRDVLTFRDDALRTGWYAHETTLTAANVKPGSFGLLATLAPPVGLPALGIVYAQPLYVSSERTADGRSHNLVIVAGSAGRIYAFDEATRAVVWYRDFTDAAAGIRGQRSSDLPCADVGPDRAIVGTPVIDRTLDTINVVVATVEHGVASTRLHAIGLGNGSDRVAPAPLSGSGISSLGTTNRVALLEVNATISVVLTANCSAPATAVRASELTFDAATLRVSSSISTPAGRSVAPSSFGPIVSSNGTIAGSGVAWTLQTSGGSRGTTTLAAFDTRKNGLPPLFRGVAGIWPQGANVPSLGTGLPSPLVANGHVYVPADGSVSVFGLLSTQPAAMRRR